MRNLVLALALMMVAAPAAADSYRFSGGLVMDGDSVAKLVKYAGQPSRVVPLENKFGASIGERWDYYIDDKLVSFEISGGKIIAIIETR